MYAAYPVRVGQVDADSCRGVEVTGEDGCGDYLGTHALDGLFLEAIVHGRVGLKPLCIVADELCALGGFHVLEVDD